MKHGSVLEMSATTVALLTGCALATAVEASPIQIELFGEFASFTNALHPGNRIGYRFHEHTPLV